jgi:mono/diheme cytochrome c family protein
LKTSRTRQKVQRISGCPILRDLGKGWDQLLLAVCLLTSFGCNHLAPSKPASALTPQEAGGQQIFVSRCSGCHYADTEKGMQGPGLEGLFRKPYLPSGAAANDARVTAVILHGRGMMPALGNTLSDQELQDLMAYLHTL